MPVGTAIGTRARLSLVNALGIGVQKCATSWLHAAAGAHPEIATGVPKELDFFSYYYDRGYQWYESHFEVGSGHAIRFENSPSYFHDPRAADRVAAYAPEMKIVLNLRDPVKRAFSNHVHEIIKGHIQPVSFETGLENNPCYIDQGRYATHLEPWFRRFGRERILIVFAENVAIDPTAEARRLYRFLGVDPGFGSAILRERRNASDRARYPLLRNSLRWAGNGMRRLGLEEPLARIKTAPPVAGLLAANSVAIRDEIPPMRAETAAQLASLFEPEMRALRDMLACDALPWERDRPS